MPSTPHTIASLIGTLALSAGLVAPCTAWAQAEPGEAASAHYNVAVKLLGQGRYKEAVKEFSLAIDAAPQPVFYCNRAVAHMKLDEFKSARDDMQTCRQTYEGSPEEIAQLDARASAITVFTNHVLPASTSMAQRLALRADQAATQPDEVAPTLAPPPSTEDRGDGLGQGQWGAISVGAGLGLIAGAGLVNWLSADLRRDFEDASRGQASQARYEQLRGELRTRQTVFYGLGAAGGVLSVLGLGLWLFDSPEPLETGLFITPTSGEINASVSFCF